MALLKDIKVGMTVRIKTSRFSTYGLNIGDRVKVSYKNGSQVNVDAPSYGPIAVTAADIDTSAETKEMIEQEMKVAKEALHTAQAKLKWMEETKSETYDEDEFKVWQILGTIDSKVSKIEKARAIAAIVKK